MNNFRVPAGDLSLQLPLTVPAGNPNNTVYDQLALIGIDLNTYDLGNLPETHAGAADPGCRARWACR